MGFHEVELLQVARFLWMLGACWLRASLIPLLLLPLLVLLLLLVLPLLPLLPLPKWQAPNLTDLVNNTLPLFLLSLIHI